MSNVFDVDATDIAMWYCHRWNIESWFKLLKTNGHQLEKWQQTTGELILKRLIVASVATTLVFKLYSDKSEEANEFKSFLVKLSGRLTKRSKPVTHSALLAGLWVFLQMCEVLNSYTTEEINRMKELASSFFCSICVDTYAYNRLSNKKTNLYDKNFLFFTSLIYAYLSPIHNTH